MIALLAGIPVVAVISFLIYFLRSSKEIPKSYRELVVEAKFQAYGVPGFFEDVIFRYRNKIGEIKKLNSSKCEELKTKQNQKFEV